MNTLCRTRYFTKKGKTKEVVVKNSVVRNAKECGRSSWIVQNTPISNKRMKQKKMCFKNMFIFTFSLGQYFNTKTIIWILHTSCWITGIYSLFVGLALWPGYPPVPWPGISAGIFGGTGIGICNITNMFYPCPYPRKYLRKYLWK